jgi:hypothetical protein
MKKFLIIPILIFSLTACSEQPEKFIGSVQDAKVINKDVKDYARAATDYYITVQKGDTKATFEISEEMFKTVNEGTVISGEYNKDYELKNITLDGLK